tara:strand:- start:532 stop:1068 length:537 start_codon:yes stop_codon:yes gene_type:complete
MRRVDIPPYLREYAADIAHRRVEANKERYNGTHRQRTGIKKSLLLGEVSREYYTEFVGVLGELLVRYYYEITPEYSRYSVSTLLKNTRDIKHDDDIEVVQNGQVRKVSIKTSEGSFKANERAMQKEDCDEMVFIMFTSKHEYIVGHYKPEEVREWPVVFGAYSRFHELIPGQTVAVSE